jgi:hypothetical protein
MKTKRFDKKLVLNKTTIADLSNLEMNAVQGGTTLLCTHFTCGEPHTGQMRCGTKDSDCCAMC